MAMQWEYLGKQELATTQPPGIFSTGQALIWRTPVPGGWLIITQLGSGGCQSFYPDANHIWTGDTSKIMESDYLLRPAEMGEGTPPNELLIADSGDGSGKTQ